MSKISLLNKLTKWYQFNFILGTDGVKLTEKGIKEHEEIFPSVDAVLKEFIPHMLSCNKITSNQIWSTDEIQFIQSL